jgi:DNA-binding PadR family transcriptional regulator
MNVPRRALREPSYFILASLLDGPLHGYRIAEQAEKLSSGRVRITTGTLYGALDRLAEEGAIAVDREQTVDGRQRRYYKLTALGSQVFAAEALRLKEAAEVVSTRVRKARLAGKTA